MFEKKIIKTRNLISGVNLEIPIFIFSKGKSPKTYIQSSIHGEEILGAGVIYHLLKYFEKNPPNGQVILVPYANPYAINSEIGRFNPRTGNNWNRFYRNFKKILPYKKPWDDAKREFKIYMQKELEKENLNNISYEEKLCITLQKLAIDSDFIIDLHCDNYSIPYIYTPEYSIQSAKNFCFSHHIVTKNHFQGSFDDAFSSSWRNLAKQFGTIPDIESYTIEIGNTNYFDLKESEKFANNILSFLSSKNICKNKKMPIPKQYACLISDFIKIYATFGGLIYDRYSLGKICDIKTPLFSMMNLYDYPNTFKKFHKIPCIPISYQTIGSAHEGDFLTRIMQNFYEI